MIPGGGNNLELEAEQRRKREDMLAKMPPEDRQKFEKREKREEIIIMIVLAIGLACIFALAGCATLSSPKQETKTALPRLTDALRDASTCWEKALLAYDRKALIAKDSPISKRIYRCLVNKGYIQTTTKPGTVAISKAEILEACMYCRPAGYVCPQNTFRIFDCLEMYRKQGMPKDQ